MRITLSVPTSIIQNMQQTGIPVHEQADLYERFVAYSIGLMSGDEVNQFDSYVSDAESDYETEAMTFESFIKLNEKKRNSNYSPP